MLRVVLLLLAFSTTALVQSPPKNQLDQFKKESATFAAAIDEVINTTLPGFALIQATKAAYLESYGAVFMLEVALEPPRNPFSSPKSAAEVRTLVTQRRKDIRGKLVELLKQKTATLESVAPAESIAIVVNWLNTNPVDLPELPGQLMMTVKKQDVLDFHANRIQAAALSDRITIREP